MHIRYFFLLLPLVLSGCIGSLLLEGDGGYLDSCFPDIRSVPERCLAEAPRNPCEGKSQEDLQNLEQDREKINMRDEALREKFFPKK